MDQFFAKNFTGHAFELFSRAHLYGLLSVLLFNIFMAYGLRKINSDKINKCFGITLAILLILQELSLNIWRIFTGAWQVSTSLPLHLCGLGIILSAIMLVKRDKRLYEFLYFWAVAGATQAMLQPDIGNFGYPHYRYFQFFVSHGLFFSAIIFATFIYKFRPEFKSIYKAFVVTNIFGFFIAIFNFLSGSNYMFLAHKPETASLLDFLGPWPLYIIPLEFLALFLFTLVYLPFLLKDSLSKSFQTNSKS